MGRSVAAMVSAAATLAGDTRQLLVALLPEATITYA
jgi:hypothetical protein